MEVIRKNFNRLLTLDFLFKKVTFSSSRRSVLLIRDDGIGDFLFFSGTLRYYKEFFERRGYELFLVVSKDVYDIAKLFYQDINIVALDKKKYYLSLNYRRRFLTFVHRVISPRIIVSSIHRSSFCDDIARFSGRGVEKVGYEGEIFLKKKGKGPYTKIVVSYDRLSNFIQGRFNHVILHELQLLNELIGEKLKVRQILPTLPFVENLSVGKILDSDYLVLIPGAGDIRRILPLEKQIELVKKLIKETGFKCVMLGGKKERTISIFIEKNINEDKIVNLTGTLNLEEALSLISKAKLVIGMETGLTHASWILNVPTVMVYGGGHFGRFLPLYSSGRVVFSKMPCFGCNWKCVYSGNYFECVSSIRVSELVNAAFSVIEENSK